MKKLTLKTISKMRNQLKKKLTTKKIESLGIPTEQDYINFNKALAKAMKIKQVKNGKVFGKITKSEEEYLDRVNIELKNYGYTMQNELYELEKAKLDLIPTITPPRPKWFKKKENQQGKKIVLRSREKKFVAGGVEFKTFSEMGTSNPSLEYVNKIHQHVIKNTLEK